MSMFGDEDRVVTYSSAVCYSTGREYVEEAEVEVALLWADKHKLLIPLGSAMDNLCRRLEEDLDLSLNDPDAQALTADEMDAMDEDEAMMIDGMEFVDAEPVSATGAGASWVVQGARAATRTQPPPPIPQPRPVVLVVVDGESEQLRA